MCSKNKFNGETHNILPILGSTRLSKNNNYLGNKHFNFSFGIIIGKFFNSMVWTFSLEVFYFGLKITGVKYFFFFLAALGLRCCVQASSSCGERGLLFVAARGLLIEVASLVAEHRLQARGLSSCGSRA